MRDLKSYEPFFGAWYIQRPIFENEFGGIYEIRKEDSDSPVQSLKVIRMPDPGIGSAEEYSQKLEKDLVAEISMMTALKEHINVTAYEEYEVLRRGDGFGWDIVIRMESVTPLPEYIRTNPFTIGDAVRLGAEVCAMLEFCHPHEIVHRNICPQNIFVSADGVYKVGDFAIEDPNGQLLAALKELDAACYTAPEVHNDDTYVPASDIYSLGILLYGLLNNNRLPFMPAYPAQYSLTDVVFANEKRFRGEEMQAPKNAGEALSAIILKACSFNVKDRYASAAEMKAALLAVLYGDVPQPVVAEKEAAPKQQERVAEESAPVVEAVVAPEVVPVDTEEQPPVEADEQPVEAETAETNEETVVAENALPEQEKETEAEVEEIIDDFTGIEIAEPVETPEKAAEETAETIANVEFETIVTDAEVKIPSESTVYEPEKDYTTPEKEVDHIQVANASDKNEKNRKNGILAAIAVVAVVGVAALGVKYFVSEPEQPVNGSDVSTDSVIEDDSVSESENGSEDVSEKPTEEATKPATTEVPSLTGMSASDAEILLQSLGFRVVRETAYNDTMAVDYVVSQTPVAKTKAKTGSVVTITVSIGKQANAVTALKFTQTSVTVRVGQTVELSYSYEPADANTDGLQWKSSAENVATVENGKVKGLALGTTQITVRSADGKTSSVCTVAVVGDSEIAVPSQVGQNKAQAVAVFEALGLNVVIKEEYSTTVAKGKVISQSIDGGKTAKAGDTITLVVSLGNTAETTTQTEPTTSGSSTTNPSDTTTTTKPSDTTQSTTQEPSTEYVAVSSVSLSRTSVNLSLGDYMSLVATVSPATASNKVVTWASSDPSVVSVAGGYLSARGEGTAKITATTADGSKTATCTVTVKDTRVTVPNVVGKSATEAASALRKAGFTVIESHDFNAAGTPDKVQSQYPVANSKAAAGSEVTITVCKRIVNIGVVASEGGTVAGGGMAVPGTKIGITAVAGSGYRFVKWDDGDTNATRTVTAGSADAVYTAIFEKIS